MRFEFRESRVERIMRISDIFDLETKLGPLPRGVVDYLKKCLQGAVFGRPPFMFGRVAFEDGREFWTITGNGVSKKNFPVKRTTVLLSNGSAVFSGKRDALGTVFTMEDRREARLMKSVMES